MVKKLGYRAIYEEIKKDIESNIYEPDERLPTEQEMSIKYSVSRPTICKVYNILQEEGYVRKKKGSGTFVIFGSKKKYTFGLLLPGAGESEIFSIINDRLLNLSKEIGFECLWDGASANDAKIRKSLAEFNCDEYIRKKVDGIFFSPIERFENADIINKSIYEKVSQEGIPMVLIDRDVLPFPEKSNLDLVCLDNYQAGYIVGRHLIEQGCTTLFFFYRPFSAYSVKQRLIGLFFAAMSLGVAFSDKNVICSSPDDKLTISKLPIHPGKTGIICANDSTAAMLMSTLEETGVRLCKDVLVCGFDDMKYAQYLKCPLTSYRQPCEEIANLSVELMLRRVLNSKVAPITAMLSGELKKRKSTEFQEG
ncbi:MAG: GntR family transcriptional regulator [Bacteroidales bacterium]